MNSPLRKLAAVFALLLASAGVAVPLSAQSEEGVGEPLACDSGFYQVIKGQLNRFRPSEGDFESIGPDHANYNAMAYRNSDGYLYAMQKKSLYRIDASGQMTELAKLDIDNQPYTGDFGDDGLLYVSRAARRWFAIDVDNFTVTRIPEMSARGGPADVANVNGKFYGVSPNGDLWIYDPAAKTATKSAKVEGLPKRRSAYGAAWATAGGNLYIGRNTGEIYQVTGYSTGSPKATQVGRSTRTNSNDGASCSLAPVEAGLADVDGPASETEPSTPEAEEAQKEYEENFEEIAETFVDLEGPDAPKEVETPTTHDPVEAADDDVEYKAETDTGLTTGTGCEANVVEDRLPRVEVAAIDAFAAETEIFGTDFGETPFGDFKILNGEWLWEDDTLTQAHDCGNDTTVILQNHFVDHYRWEATFAAIGDDNHGGLLLNQSSVDTRSGAGLVDLAEGGTVVRIGHYDDKGYYQQLATYPIERPDAEEEVHLAVDVRGTALTVHYNGEQIATASLPYAGGLVGLVVNATPVRFLDATLTGLPQ